MVSRPTDSQQGEADLARYDGIYTGTIGGCSAVAFLFANVNDARFDRNQGCYTHATLAHLAGGNPAGVDWNAMTRNCSKSQIEQRARMSPYHIAVVIFTDTPSMAELIVGKVSALGFPKRCITVYLSTALSGAGVNKHGFFGLVPGPYPG